jgi:hypothetical protein
MIFVGLGAKRFGDERLARNAKHRVEDARVRDAARTELGVDHVLAGGEGIDHVLGLGVRITLRS